MIISNKHKYLFIEVPHTGASVIGTELCKNYDGYPIIRKHASYPEFLSVASPEEKDYFVFAGVRNPLGETVAQYKQYTTTPQGVFTDPKNRIEQGGWITTAALARFRYIQDNNLDFGPYFLRFYTRPYTNLSSLSSRALCAVIRFEHLQEDFARVLAALGLVHQRLLPYASKTEDSKRSFRSYYTPECYDRARRVFGPFMQEWGYEFPREWGIRSVPWSSRATYSGLKAIKRFYWMNLRWGRTRYARAFRAMRLRSSLGPRKPSGRLG